MKNRSIALIGMALILGIVAMPGMAEAAFVNIGTLGFEYAPDNNGIPSTVVSTMGSTVTIGDMYATYQPIGIYGAGVPLAALGPGVQKYDIGFGMGLFTNDSIDFDIYKVVVTKGGYLWDVGATEIGGWTWGGANYHGGLPTVNFAGWAQRATVNVTPAADYFLNVVIQTTGDTAFPSYGMFSDVGVQAVTPEPGTVALLSMGLFGLFGAGLRRKFKA